MADMFTLDDVQSTGFRLRSNLVDSYHTKLMCEYYFSILYLLNVLFNVKHLLRNCGKMI